MKDGLDLARAFRECQARTHYRELHIQHIGDYPYKQKTSKIVLKKYKTIITF